MTKLDHALRLAKQGFPVFPLIENGKTPSIDNWQVKATTAEHQIRRWWKDSNRNIGLATGDTVVLDYDMKPGQNGADALRTHEMLGLPDSYRVKTPNGLHVYFRSNSPIRNSASRVARHVDVRGHGGYVVAPGSDIDGKTYETLSDVPPAPLPDWIETLAVKKHADSLDPKTPAAELDQDHAIARAIAYLESAPAAIEGSGGDETTYRVACRVRDFGVSAATCLSLLAEHWNPRAAPPWEPDELQQKVANAYRYATLPAGNASAAAEFSPIVVKENSPTWPSPLAPFDAAALPKRRWIVDGLLARGFLTGLVSPGGMGKTQLVCSLALAVASGDKTPINLHIRERTKVWYFNNEDDKAELHRRIAAAMQHNKLGWPNLIDDAGAPMVYLDSGVDEPLMLAKRTESGVTQAKAVRSIIERIKALNIGVFIFDPLIEFHEAEENDNVEMRKVMAVARRIAVEGDCAVLAVAHTKKPPSAAADGFAGDMDSLRGASAQANVMRIAHTLYSMSPKDAKVWGVPSSQRHFYARLDLAKSNISLSDGQPRWFRRVSVKLGGLDGESVGVLEPVALTARNERGAAVVEMLAKTIASGAGGLRRGEWCALTRVVECLHEAERDTLGSNIWRTVREAFAGPGGSKTGDQSTTESDFGNVTLLERRGREGHAIRLDENNPTNPTKGLSN